MRNNCNCPFYWTLTIVLLCEFPYDMHCSVPSFFTQKLPLRMIHLFLYKLPELFLCNVQHSLCLHICVHSVHVVYNMVNRTWHKNAR